MRHKSHFAFPSSELGCSGNHLKAALGLIDVCPGRKRHESEILRGVTDVGWSGQEKKVEGTCVLGPNWAASM